MLRRFLFGHSKAVDGKNMWLRALNLNFDPCSDLRDIEQQKYCSVIADLFNLQHFFSFGLLHHVVLWLVVSQHFRGTCCLRLQRSVQFSVEDGGKMRL
jgi:hypothetical protein